MPRDVGEWTKEKLRFLDLYLPPYLQATTSALERVYVDGFAGPGTNRIESSGELIEGSPLIASRAQAQNGTRFNHLFFIEKLSGVAAELSSTLDDAGLAGRAEVIVGDVNGELPKLMSRIARRSPTFVFLDTEGIEPRWETIRNISPWRTELLINFPLGMAINRNPDSRKCTDYFGTPDWRRIWEELRPGEAKPLIDFYKDRLRSLGYQYQQDADPQVRTDTGQRLYYLIHASKVEPAKRIMKWVQDQPDSKGQMRFKLE